MDKIDTGNTRVEISPFRFSDPHITTFYFEKHKDFKQQGHDTNITISYQSGHERTSQYGALVNLELHMGDQNESSPFFIKAIIESNFSWNESVNDDQIKRMLSERAIVLLLSYLRPFIAHMTVEAGYKPLTIPFIDIRDDRKQI